MPDQLIDMRDLDRETEFPKPTDERARFVLKRYQGDFVEMEDVHFHLNSAVMMPELPTPFPQQPNPNRGSVGGLAVLRAALLYARDNSNKKLLVVGHTDRSGKLSSNVKLSRLRAGNVIAALTGDRESWVSIVKDTHRTEDVQQILRWVTRTRSWQCDPIYIDNTPGPLTRDAIMGFQASYNEVFEASISEDGKVGPQTFGVFFDLYQEELALILEAEDEAPLDDLRANVTLASKAPDGIGCGPHHPVDPTERQRVSATDRRVELQFFDADQLPTLACRPSATSCDPKQCILYDPRVYSLEPSEVSPVPVRQLLSLQTVDELGGPAPGIKLKIVPDVGDVISLESDSDGYWKEWIFAGGSLSFTLNDGSPVRLGTPKIGDPTTQKEAVIESSVSNEALLDIVVPGLIDPAVLERRRYLDSRYTPKPNSKMYIFEADDVLMIRGEAVPMEGEINNENPISHRGGKDPIIFKGDGDEVELGRRADEEMPIAFWHARVTDNLFLAAAKAGESVDRKKLRKLIAEWLADHHPEAKGRGFTFKMQSGPDLYVHSCDFKEDGTLDITDLGHFKYRPEFRVIGRFGAYCSLVLPDNIRTIFLDMEFHNSKILILKNEKPLPNEAIHNLINTSDRDRYLRMNRKQIAAGRVDIYYMAPEKQRVMHLALFGGSGRLEDYSPTAKGVHKRNKLVVGMVADTYRDYFSRYIEAVEACGDEDQLYSLGPPRATYRFPTPAGCTEKQRNDLIQLNKVFSYRAWKAVSDQINQIWGIRTDGSIFVKAEFEVSSASVGGVRTVWKTNFGLDSTGFKAGTEERIVVERGGPTGKLTAVADPNSGKIEQEASVEIHGYTFSAKSNGSMKVGWKGVSGEWDHRASAVVIAVEYSLKDVRIKAWKDKNPNAAVPDKLKNGPDVKVNFGIGFQGARASSGSRVTGFSPGFFEMRKQSEFMKVDWSDLRDDERESLRELGWRGPGEEPEKGVDWDLKRMLPISKFPVSARTEYGDLTYAQQDALNHIPICRFASQWLEFWKDKAAK